MHVLIADDEPGTRMLLAAAISRLGHQCTEAADGTHALQLFHQLAPEAVITDWEMPGLDGTALARAIRSAPDMPYAYVIVLTGRADEDAAREAMQAGADDLVIKPLDPVALERKLIAAERMTELRRQLHGDARQDALTGVGNRRRLAEDLKALSGRVARYGHIYCVALFDIDHFKALNDRAGHRAGDDVLRAVARALSDTSAAATPCTATAAESSSCSCPSNRSTAQHAPLSACVRPSRRSTSRTPGVAPSRSAPA